MPVEIHELIIRTEIQSGSHTNSPSMYDNTSIQHEEVNNHQEVVNKVLDNLKRQKER